MTLSPHTYLLLTQFPENIPHNMTWLNTWIGTTVRVQSEADRIGKLRCVDVKVHWVSFEPLLGRIDVDLSDIEWIVIGKLTGATMPFANEWVQHLLDQARTLNIPVFIKNNVGWTTKIQEFPK